jgi:hypothetical protein
MSNKIKPDAFGWGLISLFSFPIGAALLYFYLKHKIEIRNLEFPGVKQFY